VSASEAGVRTADYAGRRVLVTGGAGFIGSELVRQLGEAGARAVVVDNLATGRREHLTGLSVELVVADVRDRHRMASLMQGAEVVFHLACLGVRHSLHSPQENHEVNASGTLQVLLAARAAGVGRVVCVSSSEVYGTARWVPMTEEHPAFPATVYGASKLAGESYARAFHGAYGVPTVVVRPFNSYGPRCHHEGDSGEVIPKFLLRCLAGQPMVIFGDGTQTRDFTYVADTARGILLAGSAAGAVGETINLGSGHETAIGTLARAVAAAADRPEAGVVHDAPRPGDVLRLCADAGKARRLLGFTPAVDLPAGLRALRAWYAGLGRSPAELLAEERVRNWEPAGGVRA
jgi:UDP-glucose 4-epimerase